MSWLTPRENPLAAALTEARRTIDMQGETIRILREQNADLLGRYHALKVAGATPEPALMAPHLTVPVAKAEPDELKALIHERAGTDYRKRAMMLRQLTADRAAGLSPEKIRDAIEQGVQSDGVPI